MNSRTITGSGQTDFTYSGNEMATAGSANLGYDENGNLTVGRRDANISVSLAYNWDNKLQSATIESNSISIKYDPAGNRVQKNSTVNGDRKYIVDVVGDLPVILLEIDLADMSIKKGYIYANSQILAQYDGGSASRYYFLHDRLGSVRQVINSNGVVVKMFTFNPFGETIEENGSFYTPWQFTGQYLDQETGQYYLRARQYSPYLARFTGRDLIMGKFQEPMTLHKFLYCGNNPINMVDPRGLFYAPHGIGPYDYSQTQDILDYAIKWDKFLGLPGALMAHGLPNPFDKGHGYRALFDYRDFKFSFQVSPSSGALNGGEFGNYCAGYALYYTYGTDGLLATFGAGQGFGFGDWAIGKGKWYGSSGGFGFDDFGSLYRITQGALDSNHRALDWFEDPSADPLLRPGTAADMIGDNSAKRFEDKVRLRWEGKMLEQLARVIDIFK